MSLKIPQEFLELAKKNSIPVEVASEFYINRSFRKSTDASRYKLVNLGVTSDVKEATDKLRNLWKSYNQNTMLNSLPTPPPTVSLPQNTYLKEAEAQLNKLIGTVTPVKTNYSNNVKGRVAIAGDLHIPFVNEKALATLLNDPADELVFMGDLFDMYSASKYRKNTNRITVWEELALGRAILAKLAAKFSKIYMISGNHDKRAIRRIQETNPEILPLIVDPIELVCREFPNIEILSTEVPNTGNSIDSDNIVLDYLAQQGDAVYGHFENFCGADAVKKVDKWLYDFEHILGINKPKVILQGHTHRLTMEVTSKGTLLVNTGCMCNPMEYQFDGHGKYCPPTIGYVVLFRENGVTDLNRTQLIHTGVR